MVKLSQVPPYNEENDGEQSPAPGWPELMSSAFSKFVESVGTASGQLSGAAEIFALEAARLLGDARERVDQALAHGGEIQQDYEHALNEIKSAQHSLQELAQQAMA